MQSPEPESHTRGGRSVCINVESGEEPPTVEKDTSRMLGFFIANPGGLAVSNILVRIWGLNRRLSIAGEGFMSDILSTLGHLDAMELSIWLPSPPLQVTSSIFGRDRRML